MTVVAPKRMLAVMEMLMEPARRVMMSSTSVLRAATTAFVGSGRSAKSRRAARQGY